MSYDSTPFLLFAGKIPGHVSDGQHGDVESVAKTDEAGGLIR